MGTPAGIFAMIRKDVNRCFRDMLNEYGHFLKSARSTHVLNRNPGGWLSDQALKKMIEVASSGLSSSKSPQAQFAELFECNPSLPTYGFKSWDDFFVRKFRRGVRPVYCPRDDTAITNCCESSPYALVKDVKFQDQFWLKGQPYSIRDMLGDATRAQPFIGGTIYQAFLSALSYHCWHAPVSGTVKEIIDIPGAYYAENYWKGFANINGPDRSGPNDSQGYICQIATRSIMILNADNPSIRDMAIIVVGMAEVSTCEWLVSCGQHVDKGELIGAVSWDFSL